MADSNETLGAVPEDEPYELIDGLIALLDDAPDVDPHWWGNFGTIVAINIGGVQCIPRDPDEPFKPGTVGATRAERYGTASRDEFMGLIRERLSELVRYGVSEDFLVRGLRNELLRWMDHMAETEGVDERRAQIRQHFREKADDPQAIAEYRNTMAASDPKAADLSYEEVRQRLLDMAARGLLDPLTVEDVVDKWAQKEHLERRCQELLSDRFIDDWGLRRAIRGIEH